MFVTNDHLAYFNIKFSILKHNIKNYVIKSFKAIAADKITVLYETSASVKKTLPCKILRIRKAVKYRAIVWRHSRTWEREEREALIVI